MFRYCLLEGVIRVYLLYTRIWSKFNPVPKSDQNSTWADVWKGLAIMEKELEHTKTLKRLAERRDEYFLKIR